MRTFLFTYLLSFRLSPSLFLLSPFSFPSLPLPFTFSSFLSVLLPILPPSPSLSCPSFPFFSPLSPFLPFLFSFPSRTVLLFFYPCPALHIHFFFPFHPFLLPFLSSSPSLPFLFSFSSIPLLLPFPYPSPLFSILTLLFISTSPSFFTPFFFHLFPFSFPSFSFSFPPFLFLPFPSHPHLLPILSPSPFLPHLPLFSLFLLKVCSSSVSSYPPPHFNYVSFCSISLFLVLR